MCSSDLLTEKLSDLDQLREDILAKGNERFEMNLATRLGGSIDFTYIQLILRGNTSKYESALTLQNLMAEILLKGSQRNVNEEEARAIPAQILQGWEELTKKGKALINQREQMEAYVQDVINRYELGKRD